MKRRTKTQLRAHLRYLLTRQDELRQAKKLHARLLAVTREAARKFDAELEKVLAEAVERGVL